MLHACNVHYSYVFSIVNNMLSFVNTSFSVRLEGFSVFVKKSLIGRVESCFLWSYNNSIKGVKQKVITKTNGGLKHDVSRIFGKNRKVWNQKRPEL